jgi:Ribosome associated membrane protein RAMP4
VQTTSKRLADKKVAKFQKNITKRGAVSETTVKKGNDYPVGPIVLGFFVFVVIGSCKCIPLHSIFSTCFVIFFSRKFCKAFIPKSNIIIEQKIVRTYLLVIMSYNNGLRFLPVGLPHYFSLMTLIECKVPIHYQ